MSEEFRYEKREWMPAHITTVAICPCGKEHGVYGPVNDEGNVDIKCECGRKHTVIYKKPKGVKS